MRVEDDDDIVMMLRIKVRGRVRVPMVMGKAP